MGTAPAADVSGRGPRLGFCGALGTFQSAGIPEDERDLSMLSPTDYLTGEAVVVKGKGARLMRASGQGSGNVQAKREAITNIPYLGR